jgi:hypothetical protein
VAAYVLSRHFVDTRVEANGLAADYYNELDPQEIGDPLDPTSIRAWAATRAERPVRDSSQAPAFVPAQLSDRLTDPTAFGRWRVIPLERQGRIEWLDVAGYVLASSEPWANWSDGDRRTYDFVLNAAERVVERNPYL